VTLLTVKETKITIGGLCGTGKGAVSEILAERLGYKLMSAGKYFRDYEKEEGVPHSVIEERAKVDPRYDNGVDEKTRKFGLENDNIVFEGRLGWYFIRGVSILLTCGYGQRIQRIAGRDDLSLSRAMDVTDHREDAAAMRYSKYYGIMDITDTSHYAFVVDTTKITAEEATDKIVAFLKLIDAYYPLR